MGRVIKTVSAVGDSAAAAGLSTAEVKTLIEDNVEFTFIKTYPITANISSFTIPSTDFDTTKYDRFRFISKGVKWRASGQPYFYAGGHQFSYSSWYGNGRNVANDQYAYVFPQMGINSGKFTCDFTITFVNNYCRIRGYNGQTEQGGYYDLFREFDAIGASGSGTYVQNNGLQIQQFNIGTGTGLSNAWDDKFYFYGAKKVSS